MNTKQDNYIQTLPMSKQGIFIRAFEKEGGAKNAVKAKCLSCSNFDVDEIRNCAVITCPLIEFRPYQFKAPKQGSNEDNTLG